jgi:hypothetical protein
MENVFSEVKVNVELAEHSNSYNIGFVFSERQETLGINVKY